MSKIQAAILLVLILSGPALADLNWTDNDVLQVSTISRNAGAYAVHAMYVKTMYDAGAKDYSEYIDYAERANYWIRQYNFALEMLFNKTMQAELKMSEFKI